MKQDDVHWKSLGFGLGMLSLAVLVALLISVLLESI